MIVSTFFTAEGVCNLPDEGRISWDMRSILHRYIQVSYNHMQRASRESGSLLSYSSLYNSMLQYFFKRLTREK